MTINIYRVNAPIGDEEEEEIISIYFGTREAAENYLIDGQNIGEIEAVEITSDCDIDISDGIMLRPLTYYGECEGITVRKVNEELRPGADLYAANLRDTDLSCANLRGADLRKANLCGVNLRRADFRGADFRGANLRGADLSGARLHGADFRSADLRGAIFHDRNFFDTGLAGADFRGADLCGAKGIAVVFDGFRVSAVFDDGTTIDNDIIYDNSDLAISTEIDAAKEWFADKNPKCYMISYYNGGRCVHTEEVQ